MPSQAAKLAAEAFESWLEEQIASQEASVARGAPNNLRFESFDHAWYEWLQTRDGYLAVVADYGLAVEALLVVLSEPTNQEQYHLAVASDDGYQWECMTETGFRRLMFLHEKGRQTKSK